MRINHFGATDLVKLGIDFMTSAVHAYRHKYLFDRIESKCLFLSCPKSGHSLIGSLLDAHPNMIIAHEVGILRYIMCHFSQNQIYSVILRNSEFYHQHGRRENLYNYNVPGQWQGQFREIKVIGDKHGEGLLLSLQVRPWLFDELRKRWGRVKYIHIIRNPFDVITSLTLPARRKMDIPDAINYFFELSAVIMKFKAMIPSDDLIEMRHEHFIEEPEKGLRCLCDFLGLSAPADYLSDCAGIVFKTPNRTRDKKKWDEQQIHKVTQRLKNFPFYAGYIM